MVAQERDNVTTRAITITVQISASKRYCDCCSFQHSEVNCCVLFGKSLIVSRKDSTNNVRLADCRRLEIAEKRKYDPTNP